MSDPGLVRSTHSRLSWADRWDHVLARWGFRRMDHRVEPGLYALGDPTPDSPVLVTANYSLSFDALRSALPGASAYILVLDTAGINVWCAAGKGTFGTEELVHRVRETRLSERVNHRVLILPQLGAPGVAAHTVKKETTFKVEYGPVRASDLPAYLQTRVATPEMRRVRFTLLDRVVLIPIELVSVLLPLLLFGLVLQSLPIVAAILAGVVLFPLLLPWLPTRDLTTKGLVLGGLVALGFALVSLTQNTGANSLWTLGSLLAYLLVLPPVTAFLALNFTGATTFTSRSGVRREIFTYIPVMAWMFGLGIALSLASFLARWSGG